MDDQIRSNHEQDTHLAGLTDGAGCTEVWEHLSQHRADDESVESAGE